MGRKIGKEFAENAGLPSLTSGDGNHVLNIKPLSFELPAIPPGVGTTACEIARKRKSENLAHQKHQVGKFSQAALQCIPAAEGRVENQNGQRKRCSCNRANEARALEHGRRNGVEEETVRSKQREGFCSREAEETKWILSEYRTLLLRMTNQQEAMEPRDPSDKMFLHVKASNKLKSLWQHRAKKRIGPVPGVEVGDTFQYRVEMRIIGLHGPLQSGIDFMRTGDSDHPVSLATSIVASGGYEDNIDNGDVLIYTGQGGNDINGNRRQIADQKFSIENVALRNNCKFKKPVRVIRGLKFSSSSRRKESFRYDGLYNVEECRRERGCSGFLIWKFKLRRQQGQSLLSSHIVRFTGKSGGKNVRKENVIKEDIAEGLDRRSRIPVVNGVDDVNSLDHFEYLVALKYPNWLGKLRLQEGCRCMGECIDADNCLCASRNGGEFPYTCRGTLIRAKPVVFECGPSCRCPPTCPNRVAQRKLKPKIEIFRTGNRDWGVRPLDFIEAGGFIVEYTGCLVASTDSMNEFVFPISSTTMGRKWGTDLPSRVNLCAVSALPLQLVEDVGFGVDASRSGNASRFIRRSSRPNIFAQYVLYDHHDLRVPHVMLFASENISPHIELSITSPAKQSTDHQRYGKRGRGSRRNASMQFD